MPDREMTLQEWCETLPGSHRVNRELAQLWAVLQEVDDAFHLETGRHAGNATEAMLVIQKHEALKRVRRALTEGESDES